MHYSTDKRVRDRESLIGIEDATWHSGAGRMKEDYSDVNNQVGWNRGITSRPYVCEQA